MTERSSIFDMIGPVMIGPSSSHTAGVVRIGRVARRICGGMPEKVVITFYNSFARTYEGHGSDRAVLAGLLDFGTDDSKIKEAPELAKAAGMDFSFRSVPSASSQHPNTVRISMEKGGATIEVVGVSRGGGLISVVEIDGFKCNFSASLHTMVIDAADVRGSIAFLSNIIAHDEVNIATMTVTRDAKNRNAKLVLELDHAIRPLSLEYLKSLPWVKEVLYIPDIDL